MLKADSGRFRSLQSQIDIRLSDNSYKPIINMNISSESLFHFTKDNKIILKIIKNGFRYNLLEEVIPFTGYSGTPFSIPGIITHTHACKAICFCDIPFHSIKNHREQYGSFVIGLTKEWGIKNGITPIRYIHYNTPDINNDKFRQIKDSYSMFKQNDDLAMMFYLRLLKGMGQIEEVPSEEELSKLPDYAMKTILIMDHQLSEITEHIQDSIGYLRAYEGDWVDRETNTEVLRKFYDEREWRVIQADNSINYLPFSFLDINHIMVLDKSEKAEVSELLIDHFKLSGDEKNEVWSKVKIWKEIEKDFFGV